MVYAFVTRVICYTNCQHVYADCETYCIVNVFLLHGLHLSPSGPVCSYCFRGVNDIHGMSCNSVAMEACLCCHGNLFVHIMYVRIYIDLIQYCMLEFQWTTPKCSLT